MGVSWSALREDLSGGEMAVAVAVAVAVTENFHRAVPSRLGLDVDNSAYFQVD